MKKKALHKDFFMEIKKSSNRFLSIFFIVAMGVAFYSGIQSAAPDMRLTGDAYFDEQNLMDLKVLGTLGLSDHDIEALEKVEGVRAVEPGYMTDVLNKSEGEEKVLHIESMVPTINKPEVTEGSLPQSEGECFLDESFMEENGYQVGDTIELKPGEDQDAALKSETYKIVGTGHSPLYISYSKGNSSLGTGEVAGYGFVTEEDFDQEAYAFSYIKAEGSKELTSYSSEYEELVERVNSAVKSIETVQCEQRYTEVKEEADVKLADAKEELEDGRQESSEKLADAKKEIEDGEKQLKEGKEKLADSKKEVEDNKALLKEKEEELSEGKKEIEDGEKALKEGKVKLEENEAEYNTQLPGAKSKLLEGEKAISEGKTKLADGESQYQTGKNQYDTGYAQYAAGQKQFDEGMASWESGKKQLEAASKKYESGVLQLKAGKKQYESGLKEFNEGKKTYETGLSQLSQAKKQYEDGMAQIVQYDAGVVALAKAKEEYQSGENQLALAKSDYAANMAKLDALKIQYEEGNTIFEQNHSAYEGETVQYQSEKAEYDSKMAALSEKQSVYDKRVQELQSSRETLARLLELIANGKATEEEIAQSEQLQSQISATEGELSAAVQEIEQSRAYLEGIRTKLEGAAARLSQLKEQLDESKKQLDLSKQALDSMEEKLSGGKAQIDANEQALRAAKVQIEVNEKTLADKKPQIEEARTTLSKAKKEIDENQKQLDGAKKQLDTSEKQLNTAKAQIKENEEKLAKAKKQIDENTAVLNKGKKELDEKAPQLAQAKAALKPAADQLLASRKTLDESAALLDEKEKELQSGKTQLTDAANQLVSAKNAIAENEQKLKDGKQQTVDGEKQLKDAKKELSDADKKITKAKKTLKKNENKLADGKKEYEDGKKEAEEKIADGEKKIADAEKQLAELEQPEWVIQDRSSLPENEAYGENAERMKNIGQVFPALFFLVAALISLTTMTRMVEEQRTQIGTLKALGYSKRSIAAKYVNYALLATLGGSIFGVLVGEKLLPYIIINAYGIMYHQMPTNILPYNLKFAALSTGAALICTLGATLAACGKEMASTPAALMRPPSPKEGKRVLLERCTFLWRHLSFTWKSTIRNLFRYKKRFLMTIFGIGGCMALLLVGYGIRDSIMDIAVLQYNELQLYDGMVVIDSDASQQEKEQLELDIAGNDQVASTVDVVMKKQSVTVGKKPLSLYLYVPNDLEEFTKVVNLRDRKTKEIYTLNDEGIILTEKIASMAGVKAGDTITIVDEEKGNIEVKVEAVCENYMTHYAYMSSALYEKLYQETPDYNTILFEMTPDGEKSAEAVGEEILNNKTALGITYTESFKGQLDDMLGSLDVVIIVLIVSAGMLAFVVLYNLNNININERKRELATIKVLGFYDNEVSAYVYRENILLTVFGIILGIVLGVVLHQFTIVTVEVDACMFGRSIKWPSFLYSILFTVGFSLIVNAVMYFKLKKIDMVESLKSVE